MLAKSQRKKHLEGVVYEKKEKKRFIENRTDAGIRIASSCSLFDTWNFSREDGKQSGNRKGRNAPY